MPEGFEVIAGLDLYKRLARRWGATQGSHPYGGRPETYLKARLERSVCTKNDLKWRSRIPSSSEGEYAAAKNI